MWPFGSMLREREALSPTFVVCLDTYVPDKATRVATSYWTSWSQYLMEILVKTAFIFSGSQFSYNTNVRP